MIPQLQSSQAPFYPVTGTDTSIRYRTVRLLCSTSRLQQILYQDVGALNKVKAKTGCTIQVESAPGNEQESVLTIAHDVSQIYIQDMPRLGLLQLIDLLYQEDINQGLPLQVRLLLLSHQALAVSGAGGQALAEISELSGATLRQQASIYVLGQQPNLQSNNQVLEVTGNLQQVGAALNQAIDKMAALSVNFSHLESQVALQQQQQQLQAGAAFTPPIMPPGLPGGLTSHDSDSSGNGNKITTELRLLIPSEQAGLILGRRGDSIRALRQKTRAQVKVLEQVPDCRERVVSCMSQDLPESTQSKAETAAIMCAKRVLDDPISAIRMQQQHHSLKLLVPEQQVGAVIGKGGEIIKELNRDTGTNIRVYEKRDSPLCASERDQVIEIVGSTIRCADALADVIKYLRQAQVQQQLRQRAVDLGLDPSTSTSRLTTPVTHTSQKDCLLTLVLSQSQVTSLRTRPQDLQRIPLESGAQVLIGETPPLAPSLALGQKYVEVRGSLPQVHAAAKVLESLVYGRV